MDFKSIIIYDFDGTLTPYALPRFQILEKCGFKDESYNLFFKKAHEKAKVEKMDLYQAMYDIYFSIIKENGFSLTDDNFCLGADKVIYNKGVINFLNILKTNNVQNYLLSSGIKTFLEKTCVAPYFNEIFATTFNYNSHNEANEVNYLMSDKNKVQAIKKIARINGYSEDDCSNIVYIGDGLTDYYAMEYVKKNGGITIFVYQNPNNKDMISLQEKDVVSFYTLADFSLDSELSTFIAKLCKIKK